MKHAEKAKRLWCGILSAVLMSSACVFPSFASGPGISEPEKYDAETLERLSDNTLEYEELPDLIHEYHTGMQVMWGSFERTRQNYANLAEELKSQRKNYKDGAQKDKDQLKNTTNPEATYALTVSYMTNKALDKAIQSAITSYSDVVNHFYDSKSTMTLRQYERQAVSGAKSLMIAYNSIESQAVILEKMKEMYDAQYSLISQQTSLGTATQTDLMAAKSNVLSAESSLSSLKSTQDDLRRKLIVMAGWSPQDNPEIGKIPIADFSRIDLMNLEEDTKKAIGNNSSLIALRHTATNKSTAETRLHVNSVEEAEQKMTIKMKELYDDVMSKKTDYEAALTGYESACIRQQAAETQQELGMTGTMEYYGLQLQYLQKMAEKEAAGIALFQALETYDWAVEGLASYE